MVLSLTVHLATLAVHIPAFPFPVSDQVFTARLYSARATQVTKPGLPGPAAPSVRERIEQRRASVASPSTETPVPTENETFAETNSQQDKTKKTDTGKDNAASEDTGIASVHETTVDQQPVASSGVRSNISERLNFDIYWMGVFVGRAQLEAVPDGKTLTIRSETHSAALISAFYKVEDYVESRIVDGRASTFKIKQREGKYKSNKEVVFDSDNKTVTYFDHLKDVKKQHTMTAPLLWDVISAFYYVRTQPLIVGQTVYLNVFDSNKFLTVEVNVLDKEKVTLSDGREVDTVKIRPVLKSDGIFQKKGDVLIWLTDDAKRTPVMMETEVPVGKVVAKLKAFDQSDRKATD